jgi:hypothetical protein
MQKDRSVEEDWLREARSEGTIYRFDSAGNVLLRDPESGVALFRYLAKQDEAEQEAKLAKRKGEKRELEERARKQAEIEKERKRAEAEEGCRKEEARQIRLQEEEAKRRQAAEEARRRAEKEAFDAQEAEERKRQEADRLERLAAEEVERTRRRMEEEEAERQRAFEEGKKARERERQRQLQVQLEGEEQARLAAEEAEQQQRHLELQRQREAEEQRREREEEEAAERAAAFNRPPSPTINTKAAMAEVNAMFARTMRFDGDNGQDDDSDTEESSDEEDGFEQEPETPLVPSQAETEDTFWSHSQQSQSQQQGFASQVISMGPSQASAAGFGESEGSTTEESETEQDFVQPPYQGQGMSRSSSASSSSSTGFSVSQSQSQSQLPQPQQSSTKSVFKPTRQPFMPRKPESNCTIGDENASSAPAGSARSAFRPARPPLSAKPLAVLPSAPQAAFAVFMEASEEQDKARLEVAGSGRVAVYADEDDEATEESEPESTAEEAPSSLSSGYAMGRRPAGANRFASMMDVMTPITERTCEFGMATGTRNLEQGMPEVRAWQAHADSSMADLEGVDDLASSRGSNWEAGRRQLELIEEEDEASRHERSRTGSEGRPLAVDGIL